MMRDFAEQTVVVTGAASGLGQVIVKRFVSLNARVIAVDLDAARLDQLQTALDGKIEPLACDVTDLAAVERALTPISADILINSAGITGKTNLRSYEVDPANVELVFRVNFFGSYHTSRALLPGMVERGYGRVLHIASIAGKEGNAGMLAYSASKAAAIAYLESLRLEMRPSGLAVVTLLPGYIETPMTAVNPYPMPFMLPAPEAARRFARVIARGSSYAVVPWQIGVVAKLLRLLPNWAYDVLFCKAPRKPRNLAN